jgi:site-specific recombinase XerD
VNLETKTMFVRKAITLNVEVDPKTGHQRLVPIAPALAQILELASKETHKATDPVAISEDGAGFSLDGMRSGFRRALAKAKIPKTRLHDLRHFFITECFRGGADAPTVQKLAGHLQLTTTQRYAHTTEQRMRDAVQVFGSKSA